MGQYHAVYNVDKKEFIHAHRIDNGSNGRGGGDAKDHSLIGSWAGDRIVVQGDCAKPSDQGFIADSEQYSDIFASVKALLDYEFSDA
jgi:hypothetical protein